MVFVVYIPPSVDANRAADIIHDLVSQAETDSADAAKLNIGDFNMCSLSECLPTYYQYVNCSTRHDACLDLCYGNIAAYRAR